MVELPDCEGGTRSGGSGGGRGLRSMRREVHKEKILRRWGNDHRSKLRKEEEGKTHTSEGAVTGKDVGGGAHPVVAAVLVFVPEREGLSGELVLLSLISNYGL
ncbi:hypothetical protein YC2023_103117 [Brassica napus]